jgi:hypothetical protein
MKYLIPALLAGANIVLALVAALGTSLSRWQYAACGIAVLLSSAAVWMAIVIGRREQLQQAPQLFIRLDLPRAARENPGLRITTRVIVLANHSGPDAFNVQIRRLCIDASKRIYAEFQPIARIGSKDEAEVKSKIIGLKSGEASDDFETIYLYGERDAHLKNNHIQYDLFFEYSDFSAKNHYRAGAHVDVDIYFDKPTAIKWLGAKQVWRRS